MAEINQKKSSKFLTTKIIRVVNFLGAILFAVTMLKDGLQIFAVYFAMYYYLWLYIIFLVLEIRYYNLTQTKLLNYLLKHPLATIGGILPILVVLTQRT
ncbi:hypothetical protein [Bizionia paragorgiae]|uniref:hypothetical protein n=1 Tax=Bizionia paragorgiae TaxID=283786 RepID=UPI00299E8E42|nr:hypothetical protein [Bizionia paragorgiae]MDX1272342.1 hypothetical protein [Bizionia paragorgiae]